eukprot:CAMPEP_0115650636 /NCGR_PEP_ID=MMETSP0272-20121206/41128_1 /TAXON_ID=71861 /ORGANISM="Scrippsiella trochoidea, Strain CCMP3099" /LENGTH=528 /DNA_ID=CAMNT_0003088361 /DNA_START=9 /DNA_END=1593 /DNA_ORIENTATION=-
MAATATWLSAARPLLLLPLMLLLVIVAETAAGSGGQWFCNHNMPWEECEQYLPAERLALQSFLRGLDRAPLPLAGEFQGRGIVMSGGPGHVMQALANLRVIRVKHASKIPVEFWHAFELSNTHCEALREWGATCRSIRLPGVYPEYQTVLPAIMLSSFRHVFWIDTDITPLVAPERLFESEAYKRAGALFWPDHWGAGCKRFGATAWANHVTRHLLDLPYDRDVLTHIAAEHEAGHLLVDKDRHWRPLCLANYLASRDFFTRVMHGYKDVFRLAWNKLNASNWLSPARPGLMGLFSEAEGKFFGPQMVHFWPTPGEFGPGEQGRPVPLYLHQKKKPGRLGNEILSFSTPLGDCVPFRITQVAFSVQDQDDVEVWDIDRSQPALLGDLTAVEDLWEIGWADARRRFVDTTQMPTLDLAQTLAVEKSRKVSIAELAQVLSHERWLRSAGRVAAAVGGLDGVWDLTYSSGIRAIYHISTTGAVRAEGKLDGVGLGQLYRNRSSGFEFVLYGVHSSGKFELARLSLDGRLEL